MDTFTGGSLGDISAVTSVSSLLTHAESSDDDHGPATEAGTDRPWVTMAQVVSQPPLHHHWILEVQCMWGSHLSSLQSAGGFFLRGGDTLVLLGAKMHWDSSPDYWANRNISVPSLYSGRQVSFHSQSHPCHFTGAGI